MHEGRADIDGSCQPGQRDQSIEPDQRIGQLPPSSDTVVRTARRGSHRVPIGTAPSPPTSWPEGIEAPMRSRRRLAAVRDPAGTERAVDDDLFEQPATWRVQAARRLGLQGEELIAGLVTGAGYPDALAPAVNTLRGVVAPVADLGAGLGAATVWLGDRAHVAMVGVEPQPDAARTCVAGLRPASASWWAPPWRPRSRR